MFSNCLKMINVLWIETCRSYDSLCVKNVFLTLVRLLGPLCEFLINARTWITFWDIFELFLPCAFRSWAAFPQNSAVFARPRESCPALPAWRAGQFTVWVGPQTCMKMGIPIEDSKPPPVNTNLAVARLQSVLFINFRSNCSWLRNWLELGVTTAATLHYFSSLVFWSRKRCTVSTWRGVAASGYGRRHTGHYTAALLQGHYFG